MGLERERRESLPYLFVHGLASFINRRFKYGTRCGLEQVAEAC